MEWYAGTSGYSYKEWKGLFYPPDLSNDAMLAYYAERLSTVEINNTFYRMPKRNVVQSWGDAVPDHFRFSIKASRRITHQMRLKDCAESVTILAKQLEVLGDKLGAVLFQLPPYLKFDAERLDAFLAILPKQLPSTFEFRHASWFTTETYDALHAHGAALCLSEDDELELPEHDATTNWTYVRLRKSSYTDTALTAWKDRIVAAQVQKAFAFFKHEDEAGGPPLAARFLEIANAPERTAKSPQRATRRSGKAAPDVNSV
jgi:uncharacterized protein YecE (DUF72 family)